jgi:hypothetical protein
MFTQVQWLLFLQGKRRPGVQIELFGLRNPDEVSDAIRRLSVAHNIPIERSDVFRELEET